jgi:hypothetical protein
MGMMMAMLLKNHQSAVYQLRENVLAHGKSPRTQENI